MPTRNWKPKRLPSKSEQSVNNSSLSHGQLLRVKTGDYTVILLLLAVIADIALVINVIHHW